LQRAGLLPDPFLGNNIQLLRAYESFEWWYVCHFTPQIEYSDPVQLVFDGLDTFATIWLNDQQIGQSSNMLIPHRFDVTQALRPQAENTLVVRITPAMA
jgi:beta-mannosidase